MIIDDLRADEFTYYVHGDGGELTFFWMPGQPYRLAQTQDRTGVRVVTDAKLARISLDISLLEGPPSATLVEELDAGWDAGAETSAEFVGPILVRDDFNGRSSGPVGQGSGLSRVRLLVRGEGDELQASDKSLPPQEHQIRIWSETLAQSPEAEDRIGTLPLWGRIPPLPQ